jgi:hypothetical protein
MTLTYGTESGVPNHKVSQTNHGLSLAVGDRLDVADARDERELGWCVTYWPTRKLLHVMYVSSEADARVVLAAIGGAS